MGSSVEKARGWSQAGVQPPAAIPCPELLWRERVESHDGNRGQDDDQPREECAVKSHHLLLAFLDWDEQGEGYVDGRVNDEVSREDFRRDAYDVLQQDDETHQTSGNKERELDSDIQPCHTAPSSLDFRLAVGIRTSP